MSVFYVLAEEHRLLWRLVNRLERGIADPDERAAGRETRATLLVLLKALEEHERLEHMLFDRLLEPTSEKASRALTLVDGQHRLLGALREEALSLLRDSPNEGSQSFGPLVQRLARLLRRHFEDEERQLWPGFNALAGRSELKSLERTARARLRAMERELESYQSEVADYLTGEH